MELSTHHIVVVASQHTATQNTHCHIVIIIYMCTLYTTTYASRCTETPALLLRTTFSTIIPGFHREGGAPWDFPPPSKSFPPPPEFWQKYIISPTCVPLYTLWFQQYDASCQKPRQNASKNAYFSKFSWGGVLPTPPLFPPPNINSSMKPCIHYRNVSKQLTHEAVKAHIYTNTLITQKTLTKHMCETASSKSEWSGHRKH